MKNFKYKFANILFFLFIISVGVLFFVLPNKPTFSEREKRELATMPEFTIDSLLDGTFTEEYAVYFSDNFPFRESLITIAQRINEYSAVSTDDGAQIVIIQDNDSGTFEDFEQIENVSITDAPNPEEVVSQTDPHKEPEDASLDDAQAITQSLYVAGDMVLTIPSQKRNVQRDYVLAVNDFAKRYPDVKVHCGVIPIAAAYYLPAKYRTEYNDQQMMINYIYDRLDGNVHKVDIYNALKSHANEYIYFRTDHHWTGLGAYYAYSKFVTDLGFTPTDLSIYDTVVYENYLGTLYDKVGGNAEMRNNPDTVIAYDVDSVYPCQVDYWLNYEGDTKQGPLIYKDIKSNNKYMVFTNGDCRFIKISTGQQTGRKLLMFKDSFGNAFVPFLVSHFDEIYVADPRYSLPSISALIKEKNITDTLFLTNITNTSVDSRVKEYRRLYYI